MLKDQISFCIALPFKECVKCNDVDIRIVFLSVVVTMIYTNKIASDVLQSSKFSMNNAWTSKPTCAYMTMEIPTSMGEIFMCMFCRSLFVLLYFFFWPLCCLFFFDIHILISPLVSSNSS
jgi:hypothetical protein